MVCYFRKLPRNINFHARNFSRKPAVKPACHAMPGALRKPRFMHLPAKPSAKMWARFPAESVSAICLRTSSDPPIEDTLPDLRLGPELQAVLYLVSCSASIPLHLPFS